MRRLAVGLGVVLAAAAVQAYVAIVNKTDHSEIHVVPAPGKVTTDGKLDDVALWNDLPMHAAVEKDGYVVEMALPWAAPGVAPKSGLALLGDLGVIYGNEGGTKNAIRYMWSDKSPEVSINNDIPSEIRIHPNQWGSSVLE